MPVEVQCDTCGLTFSKKPGLVGEKNYCSNSCHGKARRTRRRLHCDNCGTEIERTPSRIKEAKHHVCSRECQYEIRRTAPEKRFWRHVDIQGEDECWGWQGSTVYRGYGMFKADPQKNAILAHRYVMQEKLGRDLDDICVLHNCHNPNCVNPNHLRLGTQQENMRDRDEQGNTPKGETSGRSKLTREEVIEMRNAYADGNCTQRELADRYDVGKSTVWAILNRLSWKHVKEK